MKQHTQEAMGPPRRRPDLRVLDGLHRVAEVPNVLKERDVSAIVGVRTIACDAAVEREDRTGEKNIELPKLRELIASALVSRCLMPVRLRGPEMKAMRKGMKMTSRRSGQETGRENGAGNNISLGI